MWTAEKILKSNRKGIEKNVKEVKEYLRIKREILNSLEKRGRDVIFSRAVYNRVVLHLISLGFDPTELIE